MIIIVHSFVSFYVFGFLANRSPGSGNRKP
ncbi:MAG: hypothetical protein KBH06_11650 [Spirochaetes bacterium]|nr:hypothetical protein [Spirochaetota bacterium]